MKKQWKIFDNKENWERLIKVEKKILFDPAYMWDL